jgi:hypothetical protein
MSFILGMFFSAFFIAFIVWLGDTGYTNRKITQSEIDEEVKKIKSEQKHRRMFVTPPPFSNWFDPRTGKAGSNSKYIARWRKEHIDWLPAQELVEGTK